MSAPRTKLAAVLGSPIGHSKSPRIHNYWLEKLRIKGLYLPIEVDPEDFAEFIRRARDGGFSGFNVTIPHKTAAFGVCDQVSVAAADCAAVNTIVLRDDGEIVGDNTDGYGFLENLRQQWPVSGFAPQTVAVLGAGGAARSVVVALRDAGVGEIRIANRTEAKSEQLAALAPDIGRVAAWPPRPAFFEGADLIVNTTSLGMSGMEAFDLDLTGLDPSAVATDLIYAPLETPFLVAAKTQGARTIDGLGMLLHQARPGFAAWFGQEPTVDDALRAHVLKSGGWFR